MSRRARFFLAIILVAALTQILWAQLPQTLDEMKQNLETIVQEMEQGNMSGVSQEFANLNTLVQSLETYSKDQSSVVRVESFEALGIMLGDLQDSLIAHASLWKNNERFREFIPGELALLGKIAGQMLIAGLKDQSAEVQMNSILAIGVLLGGSADFKAQDFKPGNPEFQNMFSISKMVLEEFSRQFVLLSPEVNNDQLKAISDKVHEMIE